MRLQQLAAGVVVVFAGCSSAPKPPPPVLHSATYRELPPATPFVAKPTGAGPTTAQIKKDILTWQYANALDPDSTKVEFDGPEGKPPAVRNASPGVYQGNVVVARGMGEFHGPEVVVYEKQPTHEVRVWINFKPHKFHYLDGALILAE